MSFRVITKCCMFSNNSKENPKNSHLEPNNFPNQEKKVTISEYINYKIEDSDVAIENLKKDLEKNINKYDL